MYKPGLSAQALYSRLFLMISFDLRHCNLDIKMIVCLTATKLEPIIFSVLSFALANVANIYIFMILYDCYLLPA